MKTDRIAISSVFSKDRDFWSRDFQPQYIESGEGAYVKGSDGKTYLDWPCALGANLLGNNTVGFTNHLRVALYNGTAFSLPHRLEYSVAEQLTDLLATHVSNWHGVPLQVRWVKTGSDACNAAIRLGRAVTGKMGVLSSGYHGQADAFVGMSLPHWGIQSDYYMTSFKWGDMDDLYSRDLSDVGTLILEHGVDDPPPNYYQDLRKWCDDHDVLLVMDEVVTGIRYARGGACEVYGIQPDIICMGKALGNGLPIAALVAPTEYMAWFSRNDPVFVSSTNAGDPISLAAAEYVLQLTKDGKYLHQIDRIGVQLITGLREAGFTVVGTPCRSLVQFDSNVEKGYCVSAFRDRGILLNRPNFVNLAHTMNDVVITVNAAHEIMQNMQQLTDAEWRGWAERQPKQLFVNR